MAAVVGALRAELSAGIAQFTTDMGKAANSVASFSRDFKRMAGGLALGFGASEILSFSKATLQAAASLSETAQQLNVGVEAMQAYRLAFEQGGASAEAADNALNKINLTLGQVAMGSTQARDKIEALGISWRDLAAARPDDRLAMVAKALLAIPDAAKRSALEFELFGRSGRQVEAALADVSRGADVLKAKFASGIIDAETAAAADHALDKLNFQMQRLAVFGARAITPIAAGLAEIADRAEAISRATGAPSAGRLTRFLESGNPGLSDAASKEIQRRARAAGIPLAGKTIAPIPVAEPDFKVAGGGGGRTGADPLTAIMRRQRDAADDLSRDIQASIEALRRKDEEFAREGKARSEERIAVFNREMDAQAEAAAELEKDRAERAQRFGDMVQTHVISNIAQIGASALTGAEDFGDAMKRMALSVVELIVQMQIAKALTEALGDSNGGGSGWLGNILSSAGKAFAGAFADGGVLKPGEWGIAGERGPELIMGGAAGMSVFSRIPDMRAGDGGGANVHVTVSPSPYFDARVSGIANGAAVGAVKTFSDSALAGRVVQILRDPRLR